MNLVRKIKTARQVLLKHGFKEVLLLLQSNIEFYFMRFFRFITSKLRRAAFRFFINSREGKSGDKLKILYVTERTEAENGQTVRYRIYNLREALHGEAETRFEIIEYGIYKDDSCIAWADIIVLMRVEWSPMVDTLIKRAKRGGIPVAYDIDDIIFLQKYLERFCGILKDDIDKSLDMFGDKFRRQEMTFSSADFCTTSTPFIAGIMESEGKRAYVIHNGLNRRQIEIAGRIKKEKKPATRYIGYLSGSATHNQDFLQAVPALTRILEEYKDVKLNIVGYFDTDNLLQVLVKRMKTALFMKWDRLLRYSSSNYINIAPLDISNPFCHAKSELKYFEAAIVGVPTVASATDTYKQCVVSGVNGILASNENEWYVSMKALLDDEKLYENIRENGYKQVIENYSPAAIAKEATYAYQSILSAYKK